MRAVRWMIVFVAISVSAGVAANLTVLVFNASDQEEYSGMAAAVVALLVCWSLFPRLSRWANRSET